MKKVNWLLVGAGDIAVRRVGPALVDAQGSELVAICDLNYELAAKLADQLEVKSIYTEYAEALAESGADAVYIATPQTLHVDMCLKALEAGKNFLCEKPLGLNGAECLKLLKVANASNLTTSCSNYRRLSAQCKLTNEMLKNNEIGNVVGGWAVYSSPFYNPSNHPIRRKFGSSRIKELGFYMIDIVHNIFGMPSGVMAMAGTTNKELMNDVDDISTLILKFPGEKVFTIIFNCNSPGTRHELEIFGTEGRIYCNEWPPHGNGPVVKITNSSNRESHETHTDENYHLPMIEDYVDALNQHRLPVCTLESATKTEIITDAVFKSIDSGKFEPVIWED